MLYLARSRPRSAFKKLLGNANHLIITSLVGLDAVERGIVTKVPDDLRAAWSPKNAVNSAQRSRRLILDMALIRAIDAVDVYLNEAVRKPVLVQSPGFRKDIDAAGRSILKKLQVVERHVPELDDLPLAIIFLMVAWRNRGAHSEADLDAPEKYLDVLRSSAEQLANRFRGLDAKVLLSGYDAERPAFFKEVTSLINAAHHFVSELDSRLLSSLDTERFLKDTIWATLGDSKGSREAIEQARMRRATSVWGKDPKDRKASVLKLLNHQGFSTVRGSEFEGATFSVDLIETLQEQTPKSVLIWAKSSS